ncbi:MAG: hypothetical protein ACRDI2_26170, partial [Chloroflexota bacterium]
MVEAVAQTRLTRARLLKASARTLTAGALAACGPLAGTTDQQSAPTKRPVTLIVDNDWTGGDRYKVVQAWLERANKVHPHIKTELRDNAASQDKTIALFASDQQGDLY